MPAIRFSLLLLLAITLISGVVALHPAGAEEALRKRTLLECRPCGPDSIKGPLRYFFIQGCFGADFRTACRKHDLCYDTIGSSQEECDRQFLNCLFAESKKSKFPAQARFRAHILFWAVSVAGRPAWESAQLIAISKANGTYVEPLTKPEPEAFSGIFAGLAKLPRFAK